MFLAGFKIGKNMRYRSHGLQIGVAEVLRSIGDIGKDMQGKPEMAATGYLRYLCATTMVISPLE